jgi:PAS domain S-box-containing protein
MIDPSKLQRRPAPPPVFIERVVADRKQLELADGLHLPPRTRDLEIHYTAPSLRTPQKVKFRYRLDGYEDHWHDAGTRRQAFYTDLPPGTYSFRVIACNRDGVWDESGTTLPFAIAPVYYQTSWFRGLCALALSALLWSLYRFRVGQMEAQEKKFREALESMPALAFVARADGYRQFVNHGWVEYTGLTTKQAMGDGWQAAVHPEDLESVLGRWRAAVATGEPLDYDVRFRRGSDGVYRWHHVRAVALRDRRGRVVKWCGVAIDFEDRKRAEQLESDLAHVNRVTMLGELAASISHELKQPLAASMTNAKAGLRWLGREQPDVAEARDAFQRIVEGGARAVDIIDRLRSLYRKAPSQRALVDANQVVREMIAVLRSEANRCGVSIRIELGDDLPEVTADRVQLQQLLMNLMLNGIEAMKGLGGVLTVKSEVEDGRLRISVSDTGVGLPPGKADQVFNAFFTTKPQGSGMGLAISRSIVESHGGRLWASNNPGGGAAFCVTLPIAAQAANAPA